MLQFIKTHKKRIIVLPTLIIALLLYCGVAHASPQSGSMNVGKTNEVNPEWGYGTVLESGNGNVVEYAVRFMTEDLQNYGGMNLHTIMFYPYNVENINRCTINVYRGGGAAGGSYDSGQAVLTQSVDPEDLFAYSWNYVELDERVVIDTDQEMWYSITFELKNSASGGQILGLSKENSVEAAKGNLVRYPNSSANSSWKLYATTRNYSIRAYVEDMETYSENRILSPGDVDRLGDWSMNLVPTEGNHIVEYMTRLTPDQLAGYDGMIMDELAFSVCNIADIYKCNIKIYSGGSKNGSTFDPGIQIYSQEVDVDTLSSYMWNYVELNQGIEIDADKELWYGIELEMKFSSDLTKTVRIGKEGKGIPGETSLTRVMGGEDWYSLEVARNYCMKVYLDYPVTSIDISNVTLPEAGNMASYDWKLDDWTTCEPFGAYADACFWKVSDTPMTYDILTDSSGWSGKTGTMQFKNKRYYAVQFAVRVYNDCRVTENTKCKVNGNDAILIPADPNNGIYLVTYWFDQVTSFDDVEEGIWFDEAANFVSDFNIMKGTKPRTFAPYENLARAQFAVMLHRMNGEPSMGYFEKFPDVEKDMWYTDAILWANDIGVVTGYNNGYFGPADYITREQMATMMWRYAQCKGYDVSNTADFSGFTDAAYVSDFAEEAMRWAVGEGIITGKDHETRLDPQGNASRAECAIIMMRFIRANSVG